MTHVTCRSNFLFGQHSYCVAPFHQSSMLLTLRWSTPLPPRARCCIAITPRARTSSVLLAQFRSTGVTPFFMRRVQNESRLIILFRSSRAHRAFSFSGSTPIAPPLSTVPICLLTCAVRHLPVLSQASRDAAFQSGCTPELLLFR